MKVYKYPLDTETVQFLPLPRGAKVLSAAFQSDNQLYLWALVDEYEFKKDEVKVVTVGTGQDARDTDGMEFLSHVRLQGLEFFVFVDTEATS